MLLTKKNSYVYYWWYRNFFWFWLKKFWRRNSEEKIQMTKICDAEETSDEEILMRNTQTKKNYDKENSDEEISGGEN